MRARETLLRYQEAGKAAEVLVPIGANSFLVAQSKDIDKAFVSIGSDLLVHDDIDRQVERLDGRIKSITEAANAIGQRLGDLQRRAEAHGAAVQDLYDRLQDRVHRASGARCSSPSESGSPAGKRKRKPRSRPSRSAIPAARSRKTSSRKSCTTWRSPSSSPTWRSRSPRRSWTAWRRTSGGSGSRGRGASNGASRRRSGTRSRRRCPRRASTAS